MSTVTVFLLAFFLGSLFTVIVYQVVAPPMVPITHLYMDDKRYECIVAWEDTVVCDAPPQPAKITALEP